MYYSKLHRRQLDNANANNYWTFESESHPNIKNFELAITNIPLDV